MTKTNLNTVRPYEVELTGNITDPVENDFRVTIVFYLRQTAEAAKPYFDPVTGDADQGGPPEFECERIDLAACLVNEAGEKELYDQLTVKSFDSLCAFLGTHVAKAAYEFAEAEAMEDVQG